MKNIGDFLAKFKKLAANSAHERETIARAIKNATSFDIPEDSFKKSGSVLYINIHPTIKSEIFLRKETILAALKKEGISISNIS